MGRCFEFCFAEVSERREVNGRLTCWHPLDDTWSLFPGEAEEAIDRILEPYGSNSTRFVISFNATVQDLCWRPWALILFDREYPLAGHLVTIRRDRRSILFAPYSEVPQPKPEGFIPAVGYVLVKTPGVLAEAAASGSPMFAEACSLLKSKPDDRHWICLPDPLPPEWVQQTSLNDDDRYAQYVSGGH